MDLVKAGLDPVVVDTVGAMVIGFNIKKAEHIALATKKGLGTCDMNRIRVIGKPIDTVRREFKPDFLTSLISRFA
jgi:hypothetical protein